MIRVKKPEFITKEGLFELMAQNDRARHGYDDCLVNLREVGQIEWSNQLPTLYGLGKRAKRDMRDSVDYIGELLRDYYIGDTDFAIDIYDAFIDLLTPDDGQFVLAGGAVCELISGYSSRINDLDVFAVNMTPEVAEARIMQFIDRVNGQYNQITVYRTPNCITMMLGVRKIVEFQFITRVYNTLAQVVYGFDIAPCAAMIVFNADREISVLMTPLCAFAHRTNSFPLDLERRRASFELRILKYVNKKKFNLIFPHMTGDIKQHSAITIHTLRLIGIEILDERLPLGFSGKLEHVCNTDMVDDTFATSVYGSVPYRQTVDVIMLNVTKIMRGNNYYLVSTLRDGAWAVSICQGGAEDNLGELNYFMETHFNVYHKTEENQLTLIIFREMLKCGSNKTQCERKFGDPSIIRQIMTAALNLELAKVNDFEGTCEHDAQLLYSTRLLNAAREVSAIVQRRVEAMIPTFTWKAYTDDTALADASVSATRTIASQFKMDYIDPEVYYGPFYEPEDKMVKCAAKFD